MAENINPVTGNLQAGTMLGGRYQIVCLTGRGGFGAIYEARDTRFQSLPLVAVKEMSDAHLDADDLDYALLSFRQEADLLAQLEHPNMPAVIDFFEEKNKAYLVMEFIRGTTLKQEQDAARSPLDEKRVLGWALQLCDVLHYLHTRPQPIIFRDLKPSNVMVTKKGQIKLIDFGIARFFKEDALKDTRSLGSSGFAAPEQYGLYQSDARTDIYALGATLYILLTGVAPADSIVRQASAESLKPPRTLNPALSQAVESIVLKAIALEPANRYQSASEMFYEILATGIVAFTHKTDLLAENEGLLQAGSSQTLRSGTRKTSLTVVQRTPAINGSAPVQSGPSQAAKSALPPIDASHPDDKIVQFPTLSSLHAPFTPIPPPPPPPPDRQQLISRRNLLIGGIGAAATIGSIALAADLFPHASTERTGASGIVGPPITVRFTCSTEKDIWIKACVEAFHKSNTVVDGSSIQIELDLRGSLDAQQNILNSSIQPTLWSPASFLELNQLSAAWQSAHAGKDVLISSGDLQPKGLVFSPLVFAVWQERATVLLKKYASIDWPSIHDALKVSNWADIGGQTTWGPVKFGHTRPDKSNSGLLTIVLLAYAFFKEQRGLTDSQIDSAHFLNYFNDIEGSVYGFGRSSGTFMTNVVIPLGPPQYDIVATYENLILINQKNAQKIQHQPLELFYPGLNIVSDHPLAILQGSWVTPAQQRAAQVFRDFLLQPRQQRLALTMGFRPANPDISITDPMPGNVFLQQSPAIQVRSQIQPLAQPPTSAIIGEIIRQWQARYNGSETTLG